MIVLDVGTLEPRSAVFAVAESNIQLILNAQIAITISCYTFALVIFSSSLPGHFARLFVFQTVGLVG